jgi:hypothetical protein
MKKKNSTRAVNLLTLIPVRNIEWERNQEGLITLLKPKFRHPFLVKNLLPRIKRPFYKINLDDVGSFFWDNCDGSRTIKEIANLQWEKFGDRVEPLYERIALFIQTLEKNRFVRLNKPD